MATIRQRKSGSFEIIIRRKNLPKPIYATADTEAQAYAYAERIELQLDNGIIPRDLAEPTRQNLWTVAQWLGEYEAKFHPSSSDIPLLSVVSKAMGRHLINDLTYEQIEPWIKDMKARQLTPGSIKKRVGTLKRALDVAVVKKIIPLNPLSTLPRNYSNYAPDDGAPVIDKHRDRRLEPGEEERIREVLAEDPDMLRLFTLALESAMRMREMYTLTWDQIDIPKRTIFLHKTKNGDKRQVPMSSIALELLKSMGEHPGTALLFPYFHDRDPRKTTLRVGYHWAQIVARAGCPDLHFHDLRHEATCRIYERTQLSDLQISLITGHKDPKVLRRYANLRGSTLAEALW